MRRSNQLFLVAAILFSWMPTVFLWLDPPPLIGDEAYYARVPVEMRERRDWIVPYFNGEPRYKKPPLMYWLVALSQAIFGENEFASRLPSFIAVIVTGFLFAWFGSKVGAAEIGLWAAAVFLLNPMTAILGNWGAPEAILCLFVTASVFFGFLWLFNDMSFRWLFLSGISAGLSILTKGAPGFVLPVVVLFPTAIWKSLKRQETRKVWTEAKKVLVQFGLWFSVCLVIALPWFIVVWLREGEKFLQVFLLREHIQRVTEPMEGHRGPIWFYLPIIWILFMPWSVCLPHAFVNALKSFRQLSTQNLKTFDFPMAWWAFSVVALFSFIATKLPHYIFPALPALAWLVALQVQRNLNEGEFWLGLLIGLLPIPFIVYGAYVGFEAYADFLHKTNFKVSAELEAMKFSAYLALLGFALVPAVWFFLVYTVKTEKVSIVSGVILTLVSLSVVNILVHASGGHDAVRFWTKSRSLATFGSDTEWAIFYAKRTVPMLGRNREQLRKFLTKYSDAVILARVDLAPVLRQEGLILKRFGMWCVAFQGKQKR